MSNQQLDKLLDLARKVQSFAMEEYRNQYPEEERNHYNITKLHVIEKSLKQEIKAQLKQLITQIKDQAVVDELTVLDEAIKGGHTHKSTIQQRIQQLKRSK